MAVLSFLSSSRFYPRENEAAATLRECGTGTGKENAKCGRRIGKQRETPLVRAWKAGARGRGGGGGGRNSYERTESTRFTLRGNSGVHSRTSKSENSISVNRKLVDLREKERERERKRSTIRAQMMDFTIIPFDVADAIINLRVLI